MYNELEYVTKAFKENFKDKREPLVLYGLGAVTEGLLRNIKGHNVVGLMDGKRKSGQQWGLKILDYADVLELNVKTIIIIAKQPAIPVIFRRIEDFCRLNGVQVYDINGMQLGDVFTNFENSNPYFDRNIDDLRSAIERHEVISFDIFDTLLVRKILNPKDIFRYMEVHLNRQGHSLDFSFSNVRIQAEQNLVGRRLNPDIYEIYHELQTMTGITSEEKSYLMEKEIETELSMIKPRDAMLQLFHEVKDKKRVFLVSDMYFPKKVLEHILEKNGYQGYTDILVSCEYKKSKKEGLFDCLKERVQNTDRILHIGDDYLADVAALQGSGIDAFYIMSEREMLANSSYGKLTDCAESVTDAVLVGQFINNAFDDPFKLYKTKGKLRINTLEQYVSLFIAPVVFFYSAWIAKKAVDCGCGYILYTSRDGYLIKKIIEMIRKEYGGKEIPEGTYFYTSRRACLAATTYDDNDIKTRLLLPFQGDLYSLFLERFGIEIEDGAKKQQCDSKERIFHYGKMYREEILAHCRKERENYLHYIKENPIPLHQRIAVIDLVAKGTVQNELKKLLTDNTLVGMYFFKADSDGMQADGDMEFCSLYKPRGKYSPDCPNVYRLYRQIELVLTSGEPTFHSIGDDGKKRFMKELRSEKQIADAAFMQDRILEYSQSMAEILNQDLIYGINETILDMILGFTDSQYSKLEVRELSDMILYSELENSKYTITENL